MIEIFGFAIIILLILFIVFIVMNKNNNQLIIATSILTILLIAFLSIIMIDISEQTAIRDYLKGKYEIKIQQTVENDVIIKCDTIIKRKR